MSNQFPPLYIPLSPQPEFKYEKAISLQTLIMKFEVQNTEGLFLFVQWVRRFKGLEMLTIRV
jgi:hypothetical protein